jgi:hypothetical protein
MNILMVLVVLAVVGFALWLVTTYVPMQPVMKNIIVVVIVILVILWLLNTFGLLTSMRAPLTTH